MLVDYIAGFLYFLNRALKRSLDESPSPLLQEMRRQLAALLSISNRFLNHHVFFSVNIDREMTDVLLVPFPNAWWMKLDKDSILDQQRISEACRVIVEKFKGCREKICFQGRHQWFIVVWTPFDFGCHLRYHSPLFNHESMITEERERRYLSFESTGNNDANRRSSKRCDFKRDRFNGVFTFCFHIPLSFLFQTNPTDSFLECRRRRTRKSTSITPASAI